MMGRLGQATLVWILCPWRYCVFDISHGSTAISHERGTRLRFS